MNAPAFAPAAFTFAPLAEGDLAMLHEWLHRPHVAQWWGPAESIDELRRDYIEAAAEPRATRAFIACHAGRPVGFIQCYFVMGSGQGWWEDETDPQARGIDQFLAEAYDLNRGLGRAMIGSFVQRLFADTAASVVQTDPNPNNGRAIRCYRAVGFEPAAEVITPDGPALLLKLSRSNARR